MEGSTYFVTFRLAAKQKLSLDERGFVLGHIKSGSGEFYRLIAAVVMPDHVHIIVCPQEGFDLPQIMKGIKGVSARWINKMRGTQGKLWQSESWDWIIRDQADMEKKLWYMFKNPLKSELAEDPYAYDGWHIAAG